MATDRSDACPGTSSSSGRPQPGGEATILVGLLALTLDGGTSASPSRTELGLKTQLILRTVRAMAAATCTAAPLEPVSRPKVKIQDDQVQEQSKEGTVVAAEGVHTSAASSVAAISDEEALRKLSN